MRTRPETAAAVYGLLMSHWPGRFRSDQLADHVSLGADGLGLDSIEIVELLLECDGGGAGSVRIEELLEGGPVSIGRLIDHVMQP